MLYLMLQEHGAYFVFQTASGMSGNQMEIKASCDCYVVHIEEKPIGRYPWTCFESEAITKHNAEEVQTLCYLKLFHHSKQWDLFRRKMFGALCWFQWWWESSWPVSRGVCMWLKQYCIPTVSQVARYTPPCCYKCLHGLQWLHHLVDGEQIPPGYSPVCHFRRSRNCTFPSSWEKKQIKQVFYAARTPWYFDSLCFLL